MLLTVIGILAILALLLTIAAAMNKCPLWVPVFILCVIELLRVLPIGR